MGVSVAVVRVAANTSTGTQDITTADLGGLTPKGAILIATRAVTSGTAADGAGWYVGFTDGTNHANMGYEDLHGSETTLTLGSQDTTSPPVLIIYTGAATGTIDGSANFSAWITNGITIDWTDAPAAAYLITAYLFAGSDLSAAALVATDVANTVDNVTDITSIGFEADVVILGCNDPVAMANQAGIHLGFIHNDRGGTVVQRAIAMSSRSGQTAGQARATMHTNACAAVYLGNGSLDWYAEAGSFDSSGFSVTTRNAGANGADLCGLALRFGASPVVSSKVYTYSTPTSTGSNTDANPDFEPQFVMYLMTKTAVAATLETDADGGPVGVATVDADGDVITMTTAVDDAALVTNTQSLSDTYLNFPTDDGSLTQEATLTSMGSTGPVWNWSGVDSSAARLWAGLAIGVFDAGGGTVVQDVIGGGIIPFAR